MTRMPTKTAATPVMLARISGRTGDQLRGVIPSFRWHRLLAQSEHRRQAKSYHRRDGAYL